MTYKNYLKGIIIFVSILLIMIVINTTLYYYDVTNNTITKIIELISLIISSIACGFYIGLKSQTKGYKNGLILGGIIAGIAILLKVVITRNINLVFIGIYLLVLLLITGSSILGINKKK